MRALMTVVIAGLGLLVALPATAQQVEIEGKPREVHVERTPRVIPPPLHYETTRPPDADIYNPRGVIVEQDPAFIQPLAARYEDAEGSGRVGFSGWTSPNPAVSSPNTGWGFDSGWFVLGFSVTWGGPPAAPKAARPR